MRCERVASVVTIFGLIHEIDNSTKRISDLVAAIKRYSYMDQAAMQEVDVREDLDNTLKIFGHWIKKGITVKRDYDPRRAARLRLWRRIKSGVDQSDRQRH